jgi:hypothetical protein
MKSNEIENLLSTAQMLFDDNNFEESCKLFSQVLITEPDNPTALLYRGISSAWGSTVADSRVIEAINGFERAMTKQHERSGDSKEFFDFAISGMTSMCDIQLALNNLFVGYYNNAVEIADFSQLLNAPREQMQDNAMCISMISVAMVKAIDDLVDSYKEVGDKFFDVGIGRLDNIDTYLKNAGLTGYHDDANDLKTPNDLKAKLKRFVNRFIGRTIPKSISNT